MIGGSIWCLASLVEMRCTTSCLDSNTCCFRGHVGACCKGQSRDFHFAGYFAFTTHKRAADEWMFVSGGGPHARRVATTSSSRRRRRRRQATTVAATAATASAVAAATGNDGHGATGSSDGDSAPGQPRSRQWQRRRRHGHGGCCYSGRWAGERGL